MSLAMMLGPLFAQVLLTFILLYLMALRRGRNLVSREVKPQDISLREPNWPRSTTQAAYSFSNQFELPVLFYVLVILQIITRHGDYLLLTLSWVFVASRYLQAFEHVTSNVVQRRGAIYAVGAVVLTGAWIVFAARILLAAP